MAAVKESKKAFGASVNQYEHASAVLGCTMKFSVIDPSAGSGSPMPVIFWLSGLTCSDRNFIEKAGAFEAAVKHGVLIGFYVNATEAKWASNYKMYDYVTNELPALINSTFKTTGKQSIMGHSMGGHGALTIALKNPEKYASVSAFAPICNPTKCPWGQKAFSGYLELMLASSGPLMKGEILIDTGDADSFLPAGQLLPENFKSACESKGQPLMCRMQPGYDHSYFFIATFIAEHIAFHAKYLA